MKVVVVAPNVSENLSGEAIKAHQYLTRLAADGVDTTLITHARSRDHLGALPPSLKTHVIEDGFWQAFFWRTRVLRTLIDPIFFLQVRKLIKEMMAPDTVFQFLGPVSPISPRFPVRDANCVLGPLTGNIYYPDAFRDKEPFQMALRRRVHWVSQRVSRVLFNDKAGFKRILISGGERTRQSMRWAGARDENMRDVIDSGVNDTILMRSKICHQGENFRFVASGRHVPHKGLDLAIRAVAKSKNPVTLDIYGSGPEEENLKALTAELGLNDRVIFKGWLKSHDALVERLSEYRGYVFPSLAEANGIVVQEGLALGLPVICLNWGGPTLLTTEETAIRIAPESSDQVINDLAAAMDRLAVDPALAEALSSAGFEKARARFAWNAVVREWREGFADLAE